MELRNFLLVLSFWLAACIDTSFQQQERCVQSLDIIFCVDGSNSMGAVNFDQQKQSMIRVINFLAINESEIHVGLISYSQNISAIIELTGNKQELVKAIDNLDYPDEQTRTDLALDAAGAMLARKGRGGSVPKLIMLITDGASTAPNLTLASAQRARKAGISLFAIGVTNQIDINELNQITSVNNQNKPQVFLSDDYFQLESSLINATYRACVHFDSSTPKPPECSDAMIDIVFVVDSSFTVGNANFVTMKNFVKDFLLFADVEKGEIRVGFMTYSDTPRVQFQLNTYDRNKFQLVKAIDDVQYVPGGNNVAAAVETVRTMYTLGNGDRPDVPNVVIFLSASYTSEEVSQVAMQAAATRALGIQMYSVGLGYVNSVVIDAIASRPLQDNRFYTSGFNNLTEVTQDVYQKFNKFCETPPPVPACFMGVTDIWFVVDLSSQAEVMSRDIYYRDFDKLRNGLLKMIEIIQDPSVANPGVRTGLITYSDYANVVTNLTSWNSVNMTAAGIANLPGVSTQGGNNIIRALQEIQMRPIKSNYRSYVAIIAPDTTFADNILQLENEFTRLKDLGYTIAVFAVRDSPVVQQSVRELESSASGSRFFYYFQNYTEIEAATKNFTRDRLCSGPLVIGDGLCTGSGHRENGVGIVAHPMDCDKYIQCYYNEEGELDLGVVRQCPMGLHYNTVNMTCSKPIDARCPNDQCKESCDAYKMAGSCTSYWECEDGVSQLKCCHEGYAFIPGLGCQLDGTCKGFCGSQKWCGKCQKKPNWDEPAGYDVQMLGGHIWMPRPCFYEDFDIVDCDCTAPRDQVCPADRLYDFSDLMTRTAVNDGTKEGIRVSDVTITSEAAVLGHKSAAHVSVNQATSAEEPFTLKFSFRQKENFSPYGETLLSSGLTCGKGNTLLISANHQFIFAEVRSKEGHTAEVKVPTKGLNNDEFKTLILSYDHGVLALSITDSRTQYIAKTQAPANMCFSCGIDIGPGLNKHSFVGEVHKIAVYSCAWPILY